jgi:hypothetical protein
MKKIVATLSLVCFSNALGQVLEKPQLVEKVDTSIRTTIEVLNIEAPIQITQVFEAPIDISNQTPQFPGGQDSLNRYIQDAVESFIYADTNETFPWGESVYVAFEIATNGRVINPVIEMGYNALLDSAALDIVNNMPLWTPATNENGAPIVASYRLQILFDFDLDLDGDFDFDEEENKSNNAHWAGFEMGVQLNTNSFLSFDPNFAMNTEWENIPLKSTVFNLNLFAHQFRLFSDHVGLVTGYGFSFINTDYAPQYKLNHDQNAVTAVYDSTQNFRRSSLYGAYLTMPLLLEVKTSNQFKKAFYMNAGVLGGLRLYSHHRQTGDFDNGDKFEWITRSKFNLNPFMLDACVRVGYGPVGAFFNYALLSTFKNGTTVGQFPLRFGISLNIRQ